MGVWVGEFFFSLAMVGREMDRCRARAMELPSLRKKERKKDGSEAGRSWAKGVIVRWVLGWEVRAGWGLRRMVVVVGKMRGLA